jgi:hypothetical protein
MGRNCREWQPIEFHYLTTASEVPITERNEQFGHMQFETTTLGHKVEVLWLKL